MNVLAEGKKTVEDEAQQDEALFRLDEWEMRRSVLDIQHSLFFG